MAQLIIDDNSLKPNEEMIKRINEFCQDQFNNNDPISLEDGLIELDESNIIPTKLRKFLETECGKQEEEVLEKPETLRRKNTWRQTLRRGKSSKGKKKAPAPVSNKNTKAAKIISSPPPPDQEPAPAPLPDPETKEECNDVFGRPIPYSPPANNLKLAIQYKENINLDEYDDLDSLDNLQTQPQITPLTSKVLVELIKEQKIDKVTQDINIKYNYILDLELDKPLIDLRDLADIDKKDLFNVLCNKTLLNNDKDVDKYLDYDVSSFELKLKKQDERGKKGGSKNEQEVALGAIGDRTERMNLRTSLRAVLDKYITFIGAKKYEDLYMFIQKFKNFFTKYQNNSTRLKFENIKLEPLKKSEKSDARNIFTPTFFKEITKSEDTKILGGIEFIDNILNLKNIPQNLTSQYNRLRKHIQFNDLMDILINQEKTEDNTKANHVILNDIITSIKTYEGFKQKIDELFEKKKDSTKFNEDYLNNFKKLIDNLFLNFKQKIGDAYKHADNFVSKFRQINISMSNIDKYNRFICMKTKDILEIQFFLCIFVIEKFKELRNNKYLDSFKISASDKIGIVVNKDKVDCDILTELHEIKLILINHISLQNGGFDFKKQIKETIKKKYPLTLNKNILVGGSTNTGLTQNVNSKQDVTNYKQEEKDRQFAEATAQVDKARNDEEEAKKNYAKALAKVTEAENSKEEDTDVILDNGQDPAPPSATNNNASASVPTPKGDDGYLIVEGTSKEDSTTTPGDQATTSDPASTENKTNATKNIWADFEDPELKLKILELKGTLNGQLPTNITNENISPSNREILEKILTFTKKINNFDQNNKHTESEITKLLTNKTPESIEQIFVLLKQAKESNKADLQDKLNEINTLLTPSGLYDDFGGGAKKKKRKSKRTRKRRVKKAKK
jgi:hypothetical protein